MEKIISLFFACAASLVVVAPGCGSTASNICGIECDCEHCSDLKEDEVCASRECDANVADAYGCLQEWEDWATCFEDKGTCDEKEARYSTTEEGHGACLDQDSGLDCTMDAAVCNSNPGWTCSGGTCKFKACENGGMCTTSSDCPTTGGKDKCSSQLEDLGKCIEDNTAHHQNQQPPEGSTTGGQGGAGGN